MVVASARAVEQTFLTVKDNKTFCTASSTEWGRYDQPHWGSVVPNTPEGYNLPIPDASFSAWGIRTPSLCTPVIGGLPSMNKPVLEMTATTTVKMPGLSLGPGLLGSSNGSPQTAFPQAPIRSATATMTPSSILITTPPPLHTPSIATATGSSTASKPDELGNLISEDQSQSQASVIQPHGGENAEMPNLHTQPPTASVVPQNHPEPSMTGTSGTANEAGLDDQDPASVPVGAGDTSPQPNQASGDLGPTTFQVVPPATTATIPVSRPPPAPQSVMNVGELTTKDSALHSIIGSRTLTPGPPGITMDGTLISLQPSATALADGSSTKLLADSPKHSMLTINGVSFSPGPGSDLVVGTQAIAAGAHAVTISGKVVSLAAGGTALVVGLSTVPLVVPAAQEIVTADGLSFSRGTRSDLVIGTQTINLGAPAVTISGTPVSMALAGTAIVVGSFTESFPAAALMQGIVTAGAFTFKRGSGSDLVIGTQTITAGAPAVTISGTPISLPVDGTAVVVDGSNIPLLGPTPATTPAPTTAPVTVVINGIPMTALSRSNYIVGSQTLVPGKPAITVDGTPVSLVVGGTAVVAGGSTIQLSAASASPAVLDINGVSLTALSGSNYVVGSQTLVPGGTAITVNGTPVSLVVNATAGVVGGSTIPLSELVATTTPAVLAINGNRYTEMSNSAFLIGSQTLTPGGPAITVSGTPISLPLGATAVVVGGSTVPIPRPTSTPVVLEINGQSYTQIPGSGFLIGSQTLVPGGTAITVNGTLVSLGTAATNLVVGTQTEPLTTSQGLGEIIMGGFSDGGPGGPVATNTSSVVGFTVPFPLFWVGHLWVALHEDEDLMTLMSAMTSTFGGEGNT
ncbi:MAG: hypothetical protein Q9184_005781 [Pyrenodesmia sp. 2 TL-2023]